MYNLFIIRGIHVKNVKKKWEKKQGINNIFLKQNN